MFIKSTGGYDCTGLQYARGLYLVLACRDRLRFDRQGDQVLVTDLETGLQVASYRPDETDGSEYSRILDRYGPTTLFACVRKVTLRQFGHFMMGEAQVGDQRITLSGPYGHDGLPLQWEKLSPKARDKMTRLPDDLARSYWRGNGHNDVGSEAPLMRQWALQAFPEKFHRRSR